MLSSFGQAFRKTYQKTVRTRGTWFSKGGTMYPLATGAQKKPGLDRVNVPRHARPLVTELVSYKELSRPAKLALPLDRALAAVDAKQDWSLDITTIII